MRRAESVPPDLSIWECGGKCSERGLCALAFRGAALTRELACSCASDGGEIGRAFRQSPGPGRVSWASRGRGAAGGPGGLQALKAVAVELSCGPRGWC